MTWIEILAEAARKIFKYVVWVILWVIYMVFRITELLVHEMNGSLHKYLFPNSKK